MISESPRFTCDAGTEGLVVAEKRWRKEFDKATRSGSLEERSSVAAFCVHYNLRSLKDEPQATSFLFFSTFVPASRKPFCPQHDLRYLLGRPPAPKSSQTGQGIRVGLGQRFIIGS